MAAVLEAFALMQHAAAVAHSTELVALLHGAGHVQHARSQLAEFIQDLLIQGAAAGEPRNDIAADELATYCVHAFPPPPCRPRRRSTGSSRSPSPGCARLVTARAPRRRSGSEV